MAGLFTLSQGLYNQPAPILAVDRPHRHSVSATTSAVANSQTTLITSVPGDGLTFSVNDALLLDMMILNLEASVPGAGLASASAFLDMGNGPVFTVAQVITTALNIPDSTPIAVILQPYNPLMLAGDMAAFGAAAGPLNFPLTLKQITLSAGLQNSTAAAITVSSTFLVRYRKVSGQQDG